MSELRPQTVSRFLHVQGFTRSVRTRGRLTDGWTEGYAVRAVFGEVRVEWLRSSNYRMGDQDTLPRQISAMEKVLGTRYTVTREEARVGDRPTLIVSEKP